MPEHKHIMRKLIKKFDEYIQPEYAFKDFIYVKLFIKVKVCLF